MIFGILVPGACVIDSGRITSGTATNLWAWHIAWCSAKFAVPTNSISSSVTVVIFFVGPAVVAVLMVPVAVVLVAVVLVIVAVVVPTMVGGHGSPKDCE